MNTLATKETLEGNIFEFIDGLSGDQFETTTLIYQQNNDIQLYIVQRKVMLLVSTF